MSLLEEEIEGGLDLGLPEPSEGPAQALIKSPPIHLTALTRPFSFTRETLEVQGRPTIAELLRRAGVPLRDVLVYVDGDLVYPAYYHVVRPKPGAHVLVRVVARGSDAGKAGGALSIVIGIVLIIIGLASSPIGWGLVASGVLLVISGVLAMVIPPPTAPRLRQLSTIDSNDAESPTLSIFGGHNAARPYGVVKSVLGTHRVYPDYAAMPFTEQIGADEYVRMLFNVSLGICETDTFKIGDTPIDNFTGVEMEVRTGAPGEAPITLYSNDVSEDPLSILLLSGVAQIRTSAVGAAELSVAFVFPQGLAQFSQQGGKSATTVQITIDYRLVGQTTFVPIPGGPLIITDAREQPTRAGTRWIPVRPAGPFGASAWSQLGFASFTASRMNDGILNVTAFDADAAAAGSWLEVDHLSPMRTGRVGVISAGTGANCTWSVQGSNDRVTWDTLLTGFSTGAVATQSAEYEELTPHRYHRLLKTNAATAGPDYYEVEWWGPPADTSTLQYDVRVTRNTADSADPLLRNVSVWSALRTVGAGPPVTLPGLALIALRIKATDQLNGVVDTFNCIAHRKILDYATYAGSVKADGPLGYWRLGELAGAPTAFDASGHARSGLYQGAPSLGGAGWVVGDADTAMLLDGVDDAVTTFAGLSAIDMGGMSFTFECLFRTTTVTAVTRSIVAKANGDPFTNGPIGWGVRLNNDTIQFARNPGGGAPTISTTSGSLLASTTYHLMVRYNLVSGQVLIAINGTGVATTAVGSAIYADSFDLQIGRNPAASFWSGWLDEVAIYPSALSDERLAAHYAASLGTREWVVQRTSNPASLYRHVLQNTARPIADAKLDLAQFQAWHQENDAGGRSCNVVVDFKSSARDILVDIAACGRATPTMNDLKFATVRDLPQATPVQHFTPRNYRNYRGRLTMPTRPHALKIRFIDPTSGWQQAERIVYDDGYSADGLVPGTVAATEFEVLEFIGVTDPDLAWRLGRYHLAVMRLRPEAHEIETDVEHLACRRGDLVMFASDVTEQGIKWARVKAVATSGSNATGVTVDEALPMDALKTYGLQFRLSDGTTRTATLVTVAGDQTTVTFSSALTPPIPAIGDLCLFGISGAEAVRCIVQRIMPKGNLAATLTLVDESPAVLNADQGNIPAWDPQITIPAVNEQTPPTPIIDSVVSDETVLIRDLDGSLSSRIVVQLHYRATSNVKADFLEARWRRSDATSPFDSLPPLPADSPSVAFSSVEDGVAYDLRFRTVNREGPTSPWAEVLGYVVIGKSSPPPAPSGPRLESPSLLAWNYDTPQPDLAGFRVRRSFGTVGVWSTGLALHGGLASATQLVLPVMFGAWVLMIKAVDTSGNESTTAAMLAVVFSNAPLQNALETFDHKAAGFPGTKVGCSVNGGTGNLEASAIPTIFWTQDNNLFWDANPNELFWRGTYEAMTYSFGFTTASGSAGARIIFVSTITGPAWRILWREGSSGPYTLFQGSIEHIKGSQLYEFQLVADSSVLQTVVSQFIMAVTTGVPTLISSVDLLDNSVTTPKVAASAITTTKINDGAVMTAKIGDSQITTTKINDGAVMTAKIGDNQVVTAKLGNNAVTAAKIAAATITSTEIAADTITAGNIAANAITANELNAGAVTAAKIAANVIDAGHLRTDTAVISGSAQIADAVITTAKIADANITSAKIQDAAISNAKIGNAEITTAKIGTLQITTALVATDAIVTDKVENLNIARTALATTASVSSFTNTTEAVKATYSNVIHLVRSTDVVQTFFSIEMTVSVASAHQNVLIVRIRRGTTTGGTLIHEVQIQIPAAKGGGSVTKTSHTFQLEAPATTGNQSYVLTAFIAPEGGATTPTASLAKSRLLITAKSA